jgi:hypothetical protein
MKITCQKCRELLVKVGKRPTPPRDRCGICPYVWATYPPACPPQDNRQPELFGKERIHIW